jgi:hypothetical protein
MRADDRYDVVLRAATQPSRVVVLSDDRVASTPVTASDPSRFLSVRRIHVTGDDVGTSEFLLGSVFEAAEGVRRAMAVVGSERLRGHAQMTRSGLAIGTVTVSRVPDWCSRVYLLWVRLARQRRLRGVLDAIESAATALDYATDPVGSERLAEGILDRVALLLQAASTPELFGGAFSIDGIPSGGACFAALLGPVPQTAADPQLWVRENALYVGHSSEGATEYEVGTSLLMRIGPDDRTSSSDVSHHLRRRLAAAVAGAPEPARMRQDAEPGRQRLEELDRRLGVVTQPWDRTILPVRMELSADLAPFVGVEGALRPEFKDLLESIRQESRYTVGINMPGVRFQSSEQLRAGTYTIAIHDNIVETGEALATHRWCRQGVDALALYGIAASACTDPRSGARASWLDQDAAAKAESAGFRVNEPILYVIDALAVTLWNHADLLTTLDTAATMMSSAPALLASVRAARGGLARFTGVIQALLHERVPVREWRAIASRYVELTESGYPPGEIVEELRLLPAVRPSLPGNTADTPVYLLSPDFAETIRAGILRDGPAAALTLQPDTWMSWITRIHAGLQAAPVARRPVVVVDSPALRPFVRAFLSSEFPDLHVLSRREMLYPTSLDAAPLLTRHD